jgi:hypothetical protein
MNYDIITTQLGYYNYTSKPYFMFAYTNNVVNFAIPSFIYINHFALVH